MQLPILEPGVTFSESRWTRFIPPKSHTTLGQEDYPPVTKPSSSLGLKTTQTDRVKVNMLT